MRQEGRMSMDTTYTGTLQISVVSALGLSPIPGAAVTISYTGDPDTPLETLTTDESGQTPTITLDARRESFPYLRTLQRSLILSIIYR